MEKSITEFEAYKSDWLCKEHDINIVKEEKYYESTCIKLTKDLQESEIWKDLSDNLKEYDYEYKESTGFDLLLKLDLPLIENKPFKSLLEKTYRINVLNNLLWPDAPQEGWILPDNWFSKINDILSAYSGVSGQ